MHLSVTCSKYAVKLKYVTHSKIAEIAHPVTGSKIFQNYMNVPHSTSNFKLASHLAGITGDGLASHWICNLLYYMDCVH